MGTRCAYAGLAHKEQAVKPRAYPIHEAMAIVGKAARKGKPRKFIWVETKIGPVKVLDPVMRMDGLAGNIVCSVAPRYQATFSN